MTYDIIRDNKQEILATRKYIWYNKTYIESSSKYLYLVKASYK